MILNDHGDFGLTPEREKAMLIIGLLTGRVNLGILESMRLRFRGITINHVYVSLADENKDREKSKVEYYQKFGDEIAWQTKIDIFVPGQYSDDHKSLKFTSEEIKRMNENHLQQSKLLVADVRVMTPEIEHDLNFARHKAIPILLIYDDPKKLVDITRINSAVCGSILFADDKSLAENLKQFLMTHLKIEEMMRKSKELRAQKAEQDV